MGLDAEFTVILREIVQFLECLREVKLSSALETIRENLLIRSKTTLNIFTTTDGTTSTTEPYLHMNASSKGLLPLHIEGTNESDIQEYVHAEETAKTEDKRKRPTSEIHPDYYETFLSVNAEDERKKEQEKFQENALIDIYLGVSAPQAKSKCIKCGPLYRKEGKKLFVFEQYRMSWVALVGTHLLIYGSERDSKPYIVKGIRGYSGRPAPNAVPRDQRRSEAAFEIFKPGNKTLQFIARTSKDMEQWVAKICQVGSYGRTTTYCHDTFNHESNSKEDLSTETIIETEEITSKERIAESKLQSTFATVNEIKTVEPDQEKKVVIADRKSPPPLPPHMPITLSRKLPSLPTNRVISSYETMDDEDDDIYHRIEDFRNNKCYQNLVVSNQHENSKKVDAYDDCHAILKKKHKNVNLISKELDVSSTIQKENRASFDETYDDIASASVTREKNQVIRSENVNDTRESSVLMSVLSNDDTEASVNASSPCNKVKDKGEVQKKLPNKKSFLDRMRNRMESPQKKERVITTCRETLTPPRIIQTEEVQTYDDVSDLIIAKGACIPEETSEYICPPAPRPVFTKPLTISLPMEESIYDDISGCLLKKDQPQLKQSKQTNDHNFENQISDDDEHYKSPRSEVWQHALSSQTEEQLYDDVAILANFTARQKKISDDIKDQDAVKPSSSPDKKSWNKFVTNRKTKSNDSTSSGSNKRVSTEIADPDGFEEQPNSNRKNTFQKLINKMENSLGKVSPRAASATSMNKPYGLNTSS